MKKDINVSKLVENGDLKPIVEWLTERIYKYGAARKPATWAELMDLCECMQKAGYEQPLGISLTTDSISASQFTWLLRIYGDLYYRNEYNGIMMNNSGYQVDLTIEDPETDARYSVSNTKLMNTIFDEMGPSYVGATSSKFQDFIEQFGLMKAYLRKDALAKSMVDMRALFQFQTDGKNSPQIMLDYVGAGLGYATSTAIEWTSSIILSWKANTFPKTR
jgi:hypothetical protein